MPELTPAKNMRTASVLVVAQDAAARVRAISKFLNSSPTCVCITSRREYANSLKASVGASTHFISVFPSLLTARNGQSRAMCEALLCALPEGDADAVAIDNAAELAPIDMASSAFASLRNSGVSLVVGCDSLSSLDSSYGHAVERSFDAIVLVGRVEPYAADAACFAASVAADESDDVRLAAAVPKKLMALGESEAFVASGGRGRIVSADALSPELLEVVANG